MSLVSLGVLLAVLLEHEKNCIKMEKRTFFSLCFGCVFQSHEINWAWSAYTSSVYETD